MDLDTLLAAIPSTEEADFNSLCSALGDNCPAKGDRTAWRDLFEALNKAEGEGYVNVSRSGRNIDSVQLSEVGAAYVRDKLDAKRGLLHL